MKTLRLLAILTICAIFTLTSCSKKNDDITPDPAQPGQSTDPNAAGFFSKINGKDFRPDLVYAKAVAPGDDGYYAIYGLDTKTSDVVMVALPYSALVGTHKLSYVNYGVFSLGNGTDSFSTRVEPGEGTVTVTKMTTTNVEGTFSFTAYSDKGVKLTITDGKFNVLFK
jgi:hypothetical protein